jgi:putative tryptophan/tyrosine transport system substrate-binding protein
MRRRAFIEGIAASAAAWPLAARAQQGGKKVVGRFNAGSVTDPLNEVIPATLRELGWVEGENVVYERRFAENRLERLPEMAADLVRLNVDVIIAGGTLAPLAAKRATSTIRWGAGSWPVWRDPAATSPG